MPVTNADGATVLYISYDGLTDPLGRSQILPYLEGLAQCGHRITILSCEKQDRLARDGEFIRQQCVAAGIIWKPLAYRKHPPLLSSALDTLALQLAAIKLHRERLFDIVHCRSYIPSRAGLALKERFGVRFLFDMRGFWPDEKAEGNSWNLGNPIYRLVYRYFKRLESRLLGSADHIVSLTDAGKVQLLTRPELALAPAPITVIPCCVDFGHFPLASPDSRTAARQSLKIGELDAVLVYLGSLGSWYMLGEMLDFFKVYASRHASALFLFITADDPQSIRSAATDRGIDPEMLLILSATRDEVPRLMAAADLGIFFIKPVFSKTASSPTKMGEMLAVGMPIMANLGVGDVGEMIEAIGAGVAIGDFTDASYAHAIDQLDTMASDGSERRERSLPFFDVKLGIARYDLIYRELLRR